MSNNIPRRIRQDLMTHGEVAITRAIAIVEAMGADARLTDAVTLLAQARDRVADFVDDSAATAHGAGERKGE